MAASLNPVPCVRYDRDEFPFFSEFEIRFSGTASVAVYGAHVKRGCFSLLKLYVYPYFW